MFDKLLRIVFHRLLTVRPILAEIAEREIVVRRLPIGANMPQEWNSAFAALMFSVERLGFLLNDEVELEDGETMTEPVQIGYIVQFTSNDSDVFEPQFAGPFVSHNDAEDWIEANDFGENGLYEGSTRVIEISTDPSSIDIRK